MKVALALALVCSCGVGIADEGERARARQLKDEGAAALARGDAAAALSRFEEAYRIFPSPKLLYNVGLAQAGLARSAEALESFEAFLAGAPEAPADARAYAESQIVLLRLRVATLTVNASVDGAEISADGRRLGVAPLGRAIHVPPGSHELTARLEGYRAARASIVLAAGEVGSVLLTMAPLPGPQERAHTAAVAPRASLVRNWWLWAAVGVVVVGAAVGLGVGLGLRPQETPPSTLGEVTPRF
jgi:PEGA domain